MEYYWHGLQSVERILGEIAERGVKARVRFLQEIGGLDVMARALPAGAASEELYGGGVPIVPTSLAELLLETTTGVPRGRAGHFIRCFIQPAGTPDVITDTYTADTVPQPVINRRNRIDMPMKALSIASSTGNGSSAIERVTIRQEVRGVLR